MALEIMNKMLSNIRKFGLSYCDLPTMLWNVTFLMRALFLNIDSRNKKRISPLMYILFPIAAGCFVHVFIVSTAWFVLTKKEDSYRMVVLSLAISSEISVVKMFFIYLNSSAIKQLIDNYLSCDAMVEPNSRFSNNILKNMRAVKKRALILWFVIIMNVVVYVVKPLVQPGRHAIDEKFPLYGLEPTLESPNYELNFVSMAIGAFFTVYLSLNVSSLVIFMAGYIESQMQALSIEVKELWDDAEINFTEVGIKQLDFNEREVSRAKHSKLVYKNNYVFEKLKYIIKLHATNINLVRETEHTIRNAIAGEFLFLIMSLISDLLGGLSNTYIEIPFAFLQVGLDCLAGQKVIDSGAMFEEMLYDSQWENFNISNRKIIFIMLMNSQKTLKLSAGGITTLNYVWLMTVVRYVYSAYTALYTTMNKV